METHIGCAPDVPLQRLLAFLGLLYEHVDALDMLVTHVPSATQISLLKRGRLDLALVHEPYYDPHIAAQRVFPGEPVTAFASSLHPLALHWRVPLNALVGEQLVVVPRHEEPFVHDRLVAEAALRGAHLVEMREAPSAEPRELLYAVTGGDGVALAPRSVAGALGDLAASVVSIQIVPAVSMPSTCIAWAADGLRPELREAILEIAVELRAAS